MISKAKAAIHVARTERSRREELRLAVLAVVEKADSASGFRATQLRRHVARYYGQAIAHGAAPFELVGFAAEAGGYSTSGYIWNVKLRSPDRTERRRIAAKWNEGLPPPELSMIKRAALERDDTAGDMLFELPPGLPYLSDGVHKQLPPMDSVAVWRDGGNGARGSGVSMRRRRFPAYLANLRAYLDRASSLSSVDRQLLEFVVEGKSLQWIADELGMTKANVHKKVSAARKVGGVAGPGPGR